VGLARCGSVFPVSAVVGAAVPAAVCRWGLCPCCPDVGWCLSGVYNHHISMLNASLQLSEVRKDPLAVTNRQRRSL